VPYTVGQATGAILVVGLHPDLTPEESTMNNTSRTKLCTALYCSFGAAALCTLSTSAGAAEEPLPSTTVRFADLDVAKPAGAKILYRRIQAAARQVCRGSRDDRLLAVERACIEQAIDNAVRSVDAVALTELRFGNDLRFARK
jgi:UrcA family protein